MMRRPPPRPGVGKKSSSSGFKVTYSVNQLLTMGKELLSEEPVCPPPEGWEKYQFDKIGWVLAKRSNTLGGGGIFEVGHSCRACSPDLHA